MHDHAGWSINLGRWGGVHVRLHVLFIVFAVCTIYLAYLAGGPGSEAWSQAPLAFASLVILLAAVISHEAAHYAATLRVGGYVEELVLTPFGGLGNYQAPNVPLAELVVYLAGPLANLTMAVVCGVVLRLCGETDLLGLLQPLFPTGLGADPNSLMAWLKLTFWINWMLTLVNMLPAFPLDGGRVLQAGLALRNPRLPREQTGLVVVWLAKAAAALLLIGAFLSKDNDWKTPVPVWFALSVLAIFLFFGAKQEERRIVRAEAPPGDEGEESDEEHSALAPSFHAARETPGPLASWLARRRELQRRRQIEQEQEDERRMDEVLAKLHEGGMASLSADERAILQRVSARYRNRERP